jgi:endonuclease/exonuclease/phosphatase family metal-dependent hydrolase
MAAALPTGMRLLACVAVAMAACTYAPAGRAIVLTAPPPAGQEPTLPATFKIVTYNVHRRPGASIARAIAADPKLRDADVIVLEEVPQGGACGAACTAGHLLGMFSAYEPDFLYQDGTLGQAILSRVPIERSGLIVLPEYVNRNVALVVTLRVAGQPVTVYAVHLTDELTVEQRLHQIRPVLEDAALRTTPVVIAGDFNTPVNLEWHKIPLPRGHAAARFEAFVRSYGFATPMAGSGSTFRVLPLKLDAIYTRGLATGSYGTAHADDVSDHLALWAVMTLRTAPASRS